MNITYIPSYTSNSLYCLPVSALSEYLLNEEEQQYLESLSTETASYISSLKLSAAVKAGSTMYTQPILNDTYARQDDEEFTIDDRKKFKIYLNTKMVGNDMVTITGLK